MNCTLRSCASRQSSTFRWNDLLMPTYFTDAACDVHENRANSKNKPKNGLSIRMALRPWQHAPRAPGARMRVACEQPYFCIRTTWDGIKGARKLHQLAIWTFLLGWSKLGILGDNPKFVLDCAEASGLDGLAKVLRLLRCKKFSCYCKALK